MPVIGAALVGGSAAATGVAGGTAGLIGAGGSVTAQGLLGALGTGLSIAGTYGQYQAQAAASQQAAAQAEVNAAAQRQAAQQAQKDAIEADFRKRREDRRLRSAQGAAYAASGVVSGAGTPLAVLGETQENQNLESQDILRQGAYTARNRTIAANNYAYSAQVNRYEADYYSGAAPFAVASTALSGFNSMYDRNRERRRITVG